MKTVTDSVTNLALRLSVNVTSATNQGIAVSATVEEYNPFPYTIRVSPAGSWSIPLLSAPTSVCIPSYQAVGLAIAQGSYSQTNISSAKFFDFIPNGITVACTEEAPSMPASYAFYPWSDVVNVSGTGCFNGSSSCDIVQTISSGIDSVGGYFQNGATTATPFGPGVYTVIGGDEWGQLLITHFTVPQQSTSSNPVAVVSVTGPIPPYNPGGPMVSIRLENVGGTSIVSLSATPKLNSAEPSVPYMFVFDVNAASPFLPGHTVQDTRTLIGAGIHTGTNYPVIINGTFTNGTSFSSTVLVQIVPPTSATTDSST